VYIGHIPPGNVTISVTSSETHDGEAGADINLMNEDATLLQLMFLPSRRGRLVMSACKDSRCVWQDIQKVDVNLTSGPTIIDITPKNYGEMSFDVAVNGQHVAKFPRNVPYGVWSIKYQVSATQLFSDELAVTVSPPVKLDPVPPNWKFDGNV
jgi:hypothetical protein